ncbi:hypothetical protein Taro_035404 [Colocasia esculenta]|uniref:Uncharacterized protein n=1 Tax=Colocasia esculenta TaxID=4460 RepID=A0A843W5M3_COLES|nr:hypothetical protein [Colocasia esculenta]
MVGSSTGGVGGNNEGIVPKNGIAFVMFLATSGRLEVWASQPKLASGGFTENASWIWAILEDSESDRRDSGARTSFGARGIPWCHRICVSSVVTLAPSAQGLSRYRSTVRVCVVFLDTLTPEFELYVQLRERRQGTVAREGEQEDSRPSSSSGQQRSVVGPSPPAE